MQVIKKKTQPVSDTFKTLVKTLPSEEPDDEILAEKAKTIA